MRVWIQKFRKDSGTYAPLSVLRELLNHINLVDQRDKWEWKIGLDGTFNISNTRQPFQIHNQSIKITDKKCRSIKS